MRQEKSNLFSATWILVVLTKNSNLVNGNLLWSFPYLNCYNPPSFSTTYLNIFSPNPPWIYESCRTRAWRSNSVMDSWDRNPPYKIYQHLHSLLLLKTRWWWYTIVRLSGVLILSQTWLGFMKGPNPKKGTTMVCPCHFWPKYIRRIISSFWLFHSLSYFL